MAICFRCDIPAGGDIPIKYHPCRTDANRYMYIQLFLLTSLVTLLQRMYKIYAGATIKIPFHTPEMPMRTERFGADFVRGMRLFSCKYTTLDDVSSHDGGDDVSRVQASRVNVQLKKLIDFESG